MVNEPLNEQLSEDFHVGGRDRELPPEAQLEQLASYIEATYDPAAEQYLALLPDRVTHAAMVMLGTAVDHSMPAVAFAGGVAQTEVELGALFTPSSPTGAWSISLFDGSASARDHFWRPDVAAAAELSGVTILDVGDPSRVRDALNYAYAEGASSIGFWAFGSAAEFVLPSADAYVFTFPDEIPAAASGMPTLVQVPVAGRNPDAPAGARVKEYHSAKFIATPAEWRRRVQDAAKFLRGL